MGLSITALRIRLLRKNMKLTQEELGLKLGVTGSAIGMYELGKRGLDEELLSKYASVFNVSTDYLLGLTDDPNPSSSFTVAGQEITLTPEEAKVFLEMRKDPRFNVMFHDLASNPEKKVKMLLKMWETIKASLDEDSDKKREDGFGDLAD